MDSGTRETARHRRTAGSRCLSTTPVSHSPHVEDPADPKGVGGSRPREGSDEGDAAPLVVRRGSEIVAFVGQRAEVSNGRVNPRARNACETESRDTCPAGVSWDRRCRGSGGCRPSRQPLPHQHAGILRLRPVPAVDLLADTLISADARRLSATWRGRGRLDASQRWAERSGTA
jgi:hypothetical protein